MVPIYRFLEAESETVLLDNGYKYSSVPAAHAETWRNQRNNTHFLIKRITYEKYSSHNCGDETVTALLVLQLWYNEILLLSLSMGQPSLVKSLVAETTVTLTSVHPRATNVSSQSLVIKNVFLPPLPKGSKAGWMKTVTATNQNGCGLVKLQPKLAAISKAKIKGGISVRQ